MGLEDNTLTDILATAEIEALALELFVDVLFEEQFGNEVITEIELDK